ADAVLQVSSAFAFEGPRAIGFQVLDLPAIKTSTPAGGAAALARLSHVPRAIVYVGRRSLDEVTTLLPAITRPRPVPNKQWPPLLPAPNVVVAAVPDLSHDAAVRVMFDLDVSQRDRPVVETLGQLWSDKSFAGAFSMSYPLTRGRSIGLLVLSLRGSATQ